MFEKPVVLMLTSVLSQYIDGLNSDSFQVSMWSGKCTLTNVSLKKDILKRFGIPLILEEGTISNIEVVIPWSNLRGKAVEVHMCGVSVRCALSPLTGGGSESTDGDDAKQKELKNYEEARAAAEKELGQASGGMLSRLKDTIARNLVLSLTSIDVSMEFPGNVSGSPPSVLSLHLESLQMVNVDSEWKPAFAASGADMTYKLINLAGLAVALQIGGEISEKQNILQPITAECKAQIANNSKPIERGDMTSKLKVTSAIKAIEFDITYSQMCALAMLAMFSEQKQYLTIFKSHRPKVSIHSDSQAWLRYLGRCVITVVKSIKRKQLVDRGRLKLQDDYVELHKSLTNSVAGVTVDWYEALYLPRGKRSMRYYRLLEKVFPAYELIQLRRRAYSEIAKEIDQKMSPDEIQSARDAIQARQQGTARKFGGAMWGAVSFLGKAAYSTVGRGKKSEIDQELSNTVGDEESGDVTPRKDSTVKSPEAKDVHVTLDAIVIRMHMSNQLISTFTAESLSVKMLSKEGRFDGPVSIDLCLNRLKLLDSLGKATGSTREDPVLFTAANQKAFVVNIELTPVSKDDQDIVVKASLAAISVVFKQNWCLRMVQFTSMPSVVSGVSLTSAAINAIEYTEKQKQKSQRKSLTSSMSEDMEKQLDAEVEAAERAVNVVLRPGRIKLNLHVGTPSIILPEDSTQLRTNALIVQLGNVDVDWVSLTSINAKLNDMSIFTGMIQCGSLLKKGTSILRECGCTVVGQASETLLDLGVIVTPVDAEVVPDTLSFVQRIVNNLTEFEAKRAELSEGVSLVKYEVSDVEFISDGLEGFGQYDSVDFHPAEMILRTDGLGACILLEVRHSLEDGSPETLKMFLKENSEVLGSHFTTTNANDITIIIPVDELPAEDSRQFYLFYVRARNESHKKSFVRILGDGLAVFHKGAIGLQAEETIVETQDEDEEDTLSKLAVQKEKLRRRLELLKERRMKIQARLPLFTVRLAGGEKTQQSLTFAVQNLVVNVDRCNETHYLCSQIGSIQIYDRQRHKILSTSGEELLEIELKDEMNVSIMKPSDSNVSVQLPRLDVIVDYDITPSLVLVLMDAQKAMKLQVDPDLKKKRDRTIKIMEHRRPKARHLPRKKWYPKPKEKTEEKAVEDGSGASLSVKVQFHGLSIVLVKSEQRVLDIELKTVLVKSLFKGAALTAHVEMTNFAILDVQKNVTLMGQFKKQDADCALCIDYKKNSATNETVASVKMNPYEVNIDLRAMSWITLLTPSHYLAPDEETELTEATDCQIVVTKSTMEEKEPDTNLMSSDSAAKEAVIACRRALKAKQDPSAMNLFTVDGNPWKRSASSSLVQSEPSLTFGADDVAEEVKMPFSYNVNVELFVLRISDDAGSFALQMKELVVQQNLRHGETSPSSILHLQEALLTLRDGKPMLTDLTLKATYIAAPINKLDASIHGGKISLEKEHIQVGFQCAISAMKLLEMINATFNPKATAVSAGKSGHSRQSSIISSISRLSATPSMKRRRHRRTLSSGGRRSASKGQTSPMVEKSSPMSMNVTVVSFGAYVGEQHAALLEFFVSRCHVQIAGTRLVISEAVLAVGSGAPVMHQLPDIADDTTVLFIDSRGNQKNFAEVVMDSKKEIQLNFPCRECGKFAVEVSRARLWANWINSLHIAALKEEWTRNFPPSVAESAPAPEPLPTVKIEESSTKGSMSLALHNFPPIVLSVGADFTACFSIGEEDVCFASSSDGSMQMSVSHCCLLINDVPVISDITAVLETRDKVPVFNIQKFIVSVCPEHVKAATKAMDEVDELLAMKYISDEEWMFPSSDGFSVVSAVHDDEKQNCSIFLSAMQAKIKLSQSAAITVPLTSKTLLHAVEHTLQISYDEHDCVTLTAETKNIDALKNRLVELVNIQKEVETSKRNSRKHSRRSTGIKDSSAVVYDGAKTPLMLPLVVTVEKLQCFVSANPDVMISQPVVALELTGLRLEVSQINNDDDTLNQFHVGLDQLSISTNDGTSIKLGLCATAIRHSSAMFVVNFCGSKVQPNVEIGFHGSTVNVLQELSQEFLSLLPQNYTLTPRNSSILSKKPIDETPFMHRIRGEMPAIRLALFDDNRQDIAFELRVDPVVVSTIVRPDSDIPSAFVVELPQLAFVSAGGSNAKILSIVDVAATIGLKPEEGLATISQTHGRGGHSVSASLQGDETRYSVVTSQQSDTASTLHLSSGMHKRILIGIESIKIDSTNLDHAEKLMKFVPKSSKNKTPAAKFPLAAYVLKVDHSTVPPIVLVEADDDLQVQTVLTTDIRYFSTCVGPIHLESRSTKFHAVGNEEVTFALQSCSMNIDGTESGVSFAELCFYHQLGYLQHAVERGGGKAWYSHTASPNPRSESAKSTSKEQATSRLRTAKRDDAYQEFKLYLRSYSVCIKYPEDLELLNAFAANAKKRFIPLKIEGVEKDDTSISTSVAQAPSAPPQKKTTVIKLFTSNGTVIGYLPGQKFFADIKCLDLGVTMVANDPAVDDKKMPLPAGIRGLTCSRISVAAKHNGFPILAYEATDVIEVAVQLDADGKPTYNLTSNLGTLNVTVSKPVVDMLQEKLQEKSSPAASPTQPDQASKSVDSKNVKQSDKPQGKEPFGTNLPRLNVNIIGPIVNFSVMDEALVTLNLGQLWVDCRQGLLHTTKMKLNASFQVQPVLKLAHTQKGSPTRWVTSQSVSPVAWGEVSMDFSGKGMSLVVGPLALDTTTQIPLCLLTVIQSYLPRSLSTMFDNPNAPQQFFLNTLIIELAYEMLSPSNTILHQVQMNMSALSMCLSVNVPAHSPPATIYADIREIDLLLDEISGANLGINHCDIGVVVKSLEGTSARYINPDSENASPISRRDALLEYWTNLAQKAADLNVELEENQKNNEDRVGPLHTLDVAGLYRRCVKERVFDIRVHRIQIIGDASPTITPAFKNQFRHSRGPLISCCIALEELESSMSTKSIQCRGVEAVIVPLQLTEFVPQATDYSDGEVIEWGQHYAQRRAELRDDTSLQMCSARVQNVLFDTQQHQFLVSAISIHLDNDSIYDMATYATWLKCWMVNSKQTAKNSFLRPIRGNEVAMKNWRQLGHLLVAALRKRPRAQESTAALSQLLSGSLEKAAQEGGKLPKEFKYLLGFMSYMHPDDVMATMDSIFDKYCADIKTKYQPSVPALQILHRAMSESQETPFLDGLNKIDYASIPAVRLMLTGQGKTRFQMAVDSIEYMQLKSASHNEPLTTDDGIEDASYCIFFGDLRAVDLLRTSQFTDLLRIEAEPTQSKSSDPFETPNIPFGEVAPSLLTDDKKNKLTFRTDGTMVISLQHLNGVLSIHARKYLPEFFVLPEGLKSFWLPPTKEAEAEEKKKAKQKITDTTQEIPKRVSYCAKLKSLSMIMPEYYVSEESWALHLRSNNMEVKPMIPRQDQVGKYSGTFIDFGTLRMNIVETKNGVLMEKYNTLPPFLNSEYPVQLFIRNSLDIDNNDLHWQKIRLNSKEGVVNVCFSAFQFGKLMQVINGVLRNWAYDKFCVEEIHNYEEEVEVIGPWFVDQSNCDGHLTSECQDWVKMRVSHPKIRLWVVWYDMMRFDFLETETCPWYMHVNPLTHVRESEAYDMLMKNCAPEMKERMEKIDRDLLFAYCVPQDGKCDMDSEAHFVAFILCKSVEQKQQLMKNMQWSFDNVRAHPTRYENHYAPEITWSNQLYKIKKLVVQMRDMVTDPIPKATIVMNDFCYHQVNRQHDWIIELLPRDIDVSTMKVCDDKYVPLHIYMKPPEGAPFLQYNIVHRIVSPKCTEGCPHFGGFVNIEQCDVDLERQGLAAEGLAFFKRVGAQFGDAYSLLWPMYLLENGGIEKPLDARFYTPWIIGVDRLQMCFTNNANHVMDVCLAKLHFESIGKTIDHSRYVVGLEALSVYSTQTQIIAADGNGKNFLDLNYWTNTAHPHWMRNSPNCASTVLLHLEPIHVLVPVPQLIKKLKTYFDWGESPPPKNLFRRVNRFAGAFEAARWQKAAAARVEAAKDCLTYNLYDVHVKQLQMFAPEAFGASSGLQITLDKVDLTNVLNDPSETEQNLVLEGLLQTLHVEYVIDHPIPIIEPWAIVAKFAFDVNNKEAGWIGTTEIDALKVRLSGEGYNVLMNTVSTHTPPAEPAKAQAPKVEEVKEEKEPSETSTASPAEVEGSNDSAPTALQKQGTFSKPPADCYLTTNFRFNTITVLFITSLSNGEEKLLGSLFIDTINGYFQQRMDSAMRADLQQFKLRLMDERREEQSMVPPISDYARVICSYGGIKDESSDKDVPPMLVFAKETDPVLSQTAEIYLDRPQVMASASFIKALQNLLKVTREKPKMVVHGKRAELKSKMLGHMRKKVMSLDNFHEEHSVNFDMTVKSPIQTLSPVEEERNTGEERAAHTLPTDEIVTGNIQIQSDTFLSPTARFIFIGKGSTIEVDGQGNTLFLTRLHQNPVVTPDDAPWNLIVDVGTKVIFKNITICIKGTLRAHVYLSKAAKIDVKSSDKCSVEVITDEEDDGFIDDDDTLQIGDELELTEKAELAASLDAGFFSSGGMFSDTSFVIQEVSEMPSNASISSAGVLRTLDLNFMCSRLQLSAPVRSDADHAATVFAVLDILVSGATAADTSKHFRGKVENILVGNLRLQELMNTNFRDVPEALTEAALITIGELSFDAKGDVYSDVQRFLINARLKDVSMGFSVPDIKLFLAVSQSFSDPEAPPPTSPNKITKVEDLPLHDNETAVTEKPTNAQLAAKKKRKETHSIRFDVALRNINIMFVDTIDKRDVPVFNFNIPETDVHGALHRPFNTFNVNSDVILAIDMFNSMLSKWEPLVEEYGLRVGGTKTLRRGGLTSTVADVKAINTLNINCSRRLLTDLTEAMQHITSAWYAKPSTDLETPSHTLVNQVTSEALSHRHRRGEEHYVFKNDCGLNCTLLGDLQMEDTGVDVKQLSLTPNGVRVLLPGQTSDCLGNITLQVANSSKKKIERIIPGHHYFSFSNTELGLPLPANAAPNSTTTVYIVMEVILNYGQAQVTFRSGLSIINASPHALEFVLHTSEINFRTNVPCEFGESAASSNQSAAVGAPVNIVAMASPSLKWKVQMKQADGSLIQSEDYDIPVNEEPVGMEINLRNSAGEIVNTYSGAVVPSFLPHCNLIGEHIITLRMPLEVQNLIPFPIEYVLCTDENGVNVLTRGKLDAGESSFLSMGHVGAGKMFFSCRLLSLQGRLLRPRKFMPVKDGEQQIKFYDEHSMTKVKLSCKIEESAKTSYVMLIFAPYILINYLEDEVQVYKDDNTIPGSFRSNLNTQIHDFQPPHDKKFVPHPAEECLLCQANLTTTDTVLQCKVCTRYVHNGCVSKASRHQCYQHLVQGLPEQETAHPLLIYAPPDWDPFGGKLKISVAGSSVSNPFPFDTVNMQGSVTVEHLSADQATVTVRSVGIIIQVCPGQFLRSKVIQFATFCKFRNNTDRPLSVWTNDTSLPIGALEPKQEIELILKNMPASYKRKDILNESIYPPMRITQMDPENYERQSTAFSVTSIGRTPLKLKRTGNTNNFEKQESFYSPLAALKDDREPLEVVGVISSVVGPTIYVCFETEVIPPVRIANNTWSPVEYYQDIPKEKENNNGNSDIIVDRLKPFHCHPYFFQDSTKPQRIIVKTLVDGMVVRIKPGNFGTEDSDYEVVEKGSKSYRVSTLLGYDAIVVAIEENEILHKMRIENVVFKPKVTTEQPEMKKFRMDVRYNGTSVKTEGIEQLASKSFDFTESPPFVYDVYSSRDIVRFKVELKPVAFWGTYGTCEFAIGQQKGNRGLCTLEVQPPPDVEDASPVGEISFQWLYNASLPAELDTGGALISSGSDVPCQLQLSVESSIGISLIGTDGIQQNEECYIFFNNLAVVMDKKDNQDTDLELVMDRFQIDNQRGRAIFPVILSTPDVEEKKEEEQDRDSLSSPSIAGSGPTREAKKLKKLQKITKKRGRSGKKKVTRWLHVSFAKLNSAGIAISKCEYLGVSLQELIATLDDVFLQCVLDVIPPKFLRAEVMDLQKALVQAGRQYVMQDTGAPNIEKKVFFHTLQLHPIVLDLTFVSAREATNSGSAILVLLHTIGMAVQNIDRAPIRVNAMLTTNAFGPQSEVVGRITSHFKTQLILEVYKVLGALEFLGNPTQLISSIGEGVYDLFYEPAAGLVHSPGEFARGLARGVKSLLCKTLYGAASSIKAVTSTVATGVAALTFDEDYQRERRKRMRVRPKHFGEGLANAVCHFGRGIWDGVTGIFTKPWEGAKKEGVLGFFKGLGKGLVGLVTKPIVGALDMVSATADAVRQSLSDEYERLRSRPPRAIVAGLITDYDFDQSAAFEILISCNGGKYCDDQYVFHVHSTLDTYVLSNQRIVCSRLHTEDLKWSVSYPSIAKITDHKDPATGYIMLTVHVTRSWLSFKSSELEVQCKTLREASVFLHHIMKHFPSIQFDVELVVPLPPTKAAEKYPETMTIPKGSRIQQLQQTVEVEKEAMDQRVKRMEEDRQCCKCCC